MRPDTAGDLADHLAQIAQALMLSRDDDARSGGERLAGVVETLRKVQVASDLVERLEDAALTGSRAERAEVTKTLSASRRALDDLLDELRQPARRGSPG